MSVETGLFIAVLCAGIAAAAFYMNRMAQDPDDAGAPEVKLPDAKPLVPLDQAPVILGFRTHGKVSEGVIDGAHVKITIDQAASLEVDVPGIPSTLVLKEEPNAVLRALQGGEDFHIGDGAFDDAIRIEGVPAEVLAVLDAETRREALRDIVKHDFVIANGKLRWATQVFTTGDELASIARTAAKLASKLAIDRVKIADELATNLLTEPVPEIRLRILRLLASDFPHREETARAARLCAQDPDVSVRIAAANLSRGADAIAALTAVAKDRSAGDASRASALAGVAIQLTGNDLAEILELFLESGSSTLAIAALRTAIERGWTPPIEKILELTDAVHPDAKAAAAAILDAREPRAEAKLIAMLANNEQPVMLAAIYALGRGASLAAVEALLPLAQARFGASDVKKAAATAIAKIRERNPGGSSGQLTVTDDAAANAGQVSISDDRGAVSIAQRKKETSG